MRRLLPAVLGAFICASFLISAAQAVPAAASVTSGDATVSYEHPRPVLLAVSAHPKHPRYTVRPGDTLSSIAARYLGAARRWGGLYRANRDAVGWNPDRLRKGTELRLVNIGLTANFARHIRNALRPPPAPKIRRQATPAPAAASPAAAPPAAAPAAVSVTYTGSSSMQQCIIARESGGNSQVMNATGHYGLYQFSESTWVAHGGNPADFGRASVAEQNAVFAATVAADGYSDWAPYDGC